MLCLSKNNHHYHATKPLEECYIELFGNSKAYANRMRDLGIYDNLYLRNLWDVITHHCLRFSGCFVKPPLELGMGE